MSRRHNRRSIVKPLSVISGRVLLLQDFIVDPRRGAGFVLAEVDAADLPEDAMYYGKNNQTNQIMYITIKAREKECRWRLTASVDPVWELDKSYKWRDEVRQTKEENEMRVLCPEPPTNTN